MEQNYLITYDLNTPGQDYDSLYRAIKSLGSWHHPLDSVWFVKSTKAASEIRDTLGGVVGSNDGIFVTKASGWASRSMVGTAEWLNR